MNNQGLNKLFAFLSILLFIAVLYLSGWLVYESDFPLWTQAPTGLLMGLAIVFSAINAATKTFKIL